MAEKSLVRLSRKFRGIDRALLELSRRTGALLAGLGIKLAVPGEAWVSRQIFDPPMGPDIAALQWKIVFEFPNGQGESLIWRRFAPQLSCVHSLGCQRESQAASTSRPRHYKGAVSCTVDAVLTFRNPNGHGFRVVHEPAEGIHHLHIEYDPAPDKRMSKSDKSELKLKLGEIFSDVSSHNCS